MKKPFSVILLSTLLLFQLAPLVDAAETGDTVAGTGENIDNGGSTDWSNPGNITADDTSYASITLGDPENSDYLRARNFGFSLPSDITVTGIEARVNRKGSASDAIAELNVFLVIGGTTQDDPGEDDKQNGDSFPTSFATKVYGGSGDIWGQSSVSDTDVENANFGFDLAASGTNGGGTGEVDFMEMNIYYSLPATATLGVDSDPTNDVDCGVDFITGSWDASVTVYIVFDKAVTGFSDSGDVESTVGTVGTIQSQSSSIYYVDITGINDSGSDNTEDFTVTVIQNAVNEKNAAVSRTYTVATANTSLCDCYYDGTALGWRFEEESGTTAEDSSGVNNDGTLNNFSGSYWQQCKASTEPGNAYSLVFDGTDDYISNTDFAVGVNDNIYFFVWVRSHSDDPDNFTIAQINDSAGANLLTVSYRNDVTNYLSVTRQEGAAAEKISDTSFDITDWNLIGIYVNNDTISDVRVNGSTVISSGDSSNAAAGTATEQVLAGASYNASTYENYFDGEIDEFTITTNINSTFATINTNLYAKKNSSCTALSTYSITNLPGTHAVRLVSNDSTNPASTALVGNTYAIRLKEGSVPVTDVNVDLTQDRNWSGIVADADTANSKAVADFDAGHGKSGAKTLYVQKNSNTSLRVCPNAETLEDVSSDCTNGVLIADGSSASVTFPSGTSTVSVTSPEIDGTEYLKATGMLGSGGQGEGGGGGGQAPEFTWWALMLLGMMCAYVLLRDPRFMHILKGPRLG